VSSPVICISASDGANAAEVATAVGEALGFPVINDEIVSRAAAEAGVDKQSIVDVEQRKSAVSKIMARLSPSSGAARDKEVAHSVDAQITAGMIGVAFAGNADSKRPSEELRGLIRSAIDEFMAQGNVVILTHAAAQSLAGRDGVVRVFITASPATRSKRLAEQFNVDAKHADGMVKNGDAGRADYLKRFYEIEHEGPTHYDIVINTDKLTASEAAAAIVSLAAR
jgi:cytidylate kinase